VRYTTQGSDNWHAMTRDQREIAIRDMPLYRESNASRMVGKWAIAIMVLTAIYFVGAFLR
jgi:hypothetical protein